MADTFFQSTVLYSRFGSGIGTNQLMKMVAGSIVPGRPLGNLYFTAWSHSTIAQSLNLAGDLKLGEYREFQEFRQTQVISLDPLY